MCIVYVLLQQQDLVFCCQAYIQQLKPQDPKQFLIIEELFNSVNTQSLDFPPKSFNLSHLSSFSSRYKNKPTNHTCLLMVSDDLNIVSENRLFLY